MTSLQELLKWLADLGITPLEIVTLVAVVFLYRDNRALVERVKGNEETVAKYTDILNLLETERRSRQ
jgi:ribosomal protein S28E/S33